MVATTVSVFITSLVDCDRILVDVPRSTCEVLVRLGEVGDLDEMVVDVAEVLLGHLRDVLGVAAGENAHRFAHRPDDFSERQQVPSDVVERDEHTRAGSSENTVLDAFDRGLDPVD
jgi:hypothetical protein